MNHTERMTAAGRPVTWYVEQQVERGTWREEQIAPDVSGLTRPITVFRGARKGDLIAYAWHGDRETFCPPRWWDLAIGSGACNLGCRACFLVLTHRIKRDPWRHLLYDNVNDFTHAAEQWLNHPARRKQDTLGVGIDRSDSLLYEGVTSHVRNLAPLFASAHNRCGNRLILLTKSSNTHYLADIKQEHRERIVVSFSLNPQEIADCWEGVWPDGERIPPSIAQRLEAARFAQELGFKIRVRVDPILTPPGWQEAYAAFFSQVRAMGLDFAYYTLGTYREKNSQLQVWAARWGMAPMTWQPEEGEMTREGTHRHLSEERRREIYAIVIESIRREFSLAKVSLCKETNAIRKKLAMCNANCNCLR